MTSADGTDRPGVDAPTRRRLLQAAGGLALLGSGLAGSVDRDGARAGGSSDDSERAAVAFCGPDAVCASHTATVVVDDGPGGSFDRRSMEPGCHVPTDGAIVAVEVGGERLPNPSPAVEAAVAAYRERAGGD